MTGFDGRGPCSAVPSPASWSTGVTERPFGTVVVGGGLAGIAAALRLADQGRRVALLESRARLGGVAGSFVRHGMPADTGQHVALRCYSRYRALLDRLGVADRLPVQPALDLPVLLDGGRLTRLRRPRALPAPVDGLATILRYGGLTPAERLSAVRAGSALRRLPLGDPELDRRTFGDWLREHRQSARAVRRLWAVIIVSALNTAPDRASLALAAHVLQTALLADPAAGDLAVPAVPLDQLHGRPAARTLAAAGVRVLTDERVRRVEVDAGRFVLRTAGGRLDAEEVVLAVPHRAAAGLFPRGCGPEPSTWSALRSSPIVNVHLVLDRAVTDLPLAALPDCPAQWLFDKTRVVGLDTGQYLVTSVSHAVAEQQTRAGALIDEHLIALRRVLPRLGPARVLDAFVTREPDATFDQRAGTAALRPGAATTVPGLVLAGAWTATGYPDTMEGAVRSGEQAADLLLARAVAPSGCAVREAVL